MSREPLLKVRGLVKRFPGGTGEITILHGLDLDIHAGEMVAIVGQSGSGKSTLMHLLGCLDRPSAGTYRIDGKDTTQLDARERARLRREQIGFVFQRYHLLDDLNARENVCVGAVYAGMPAGKRRRRADQLLARLGLSERANHRPNQLSGGEAQRVSIARALMNGGRIIFADEPTGALDSVSGKEVMAILGELNAAGHTIVLVTHDPQIAAAAERVIELKDGAIVADTLRKPRLAKTRMVEKPDNGARFTGTGLIPVVAIALRAILGHKLRAFLTMLGIIIGIASVVSMVALGQGSRQKVLARISDLGSNTIQVFAGRFGARHAGRIPTLTATDAAVLARQRFIDSATPMVQGNTEVRIANRTLSARGFGVGRQYFQVQNLARVKGRALNRADIERHEAVAYLDRDGARRLFGKADPLGQILLVDTLPVTVIGVIDSKNQANFSRGNKLNIWLPYTAVMSRLFGKDILSSIIVRIADDVDSETAEDAVTRILTRRHGSRDFTLVNNDALRSAITRTSRTLSRLITAIAVIALVVGGIGVMNIMLVSVTERTREIGIRMAVGARQSDIMRQFLIEAVLLCLIGGVLGIALAYGFGWLVATSGSGFVMIYSAASVILAFASATAIGIGFGYLPARNAARLDPVKALTNE